jgi:hypothetical protein
MALSETTKPATARHGEPASNVDRFEGEIDNHNTLTGKQAQRLSRLYALTLETAAAIASLAYAGGPR